MSIIDGDRLACDDPMCKTKGGSVRPYEIVFHDGRMVTDLCRKHAEPLTDLRKVLTRAGVATLPRHAPARGMTLTSAADLPDEL